MKFFKTLVLSIILFSFCQVSQAQNCNSWSGVARDLANNASGWLAAQGCSVATFVSDAADGNLSNASCRAFLNRAPDFFQNQADYWNQNISGWSTLGPRNLQLARSQRGTIVSTAGRMFVTRNPMRQDRLKLTIKEQGGKGKTSITVCMTDLQGNTDNINTLWFNDSSSSKKRSGEVRTLNLNDTFGKIITIHFDGKSVGNTFKYEVDLRRR